MLQLIQNYGLQEIAGTVVFFALLALGTAIYYFIKNYNLILERVHAVFYTLVYRYNHSNRRRYMRYIARLARKF